jgi:RimJ/RimL family protein N-acetyltransferase
MAPPSEGSPLSDGVVELRLIEKRDLDTVRRAARDSEIRRRFGLLKESPSEYFARYREASRAGSGAAFAICDVGGECAGFVTVELREAGRAELGYWLLPEGRGRGRATRALRLVSRWALSQPDVARLELSTSPENTASQRVAERSGFRREGVLRSYHVVDGRREDAVFFSLLPGDLDERAASAPGSEAVNG